MIRLDILSDPICPWCYIGKARLEQALAQRPDHPLEIQWHPFQLNDTMPKGGMDRRAYLEAKFGGQKGAIQVYSEIADHAAKAGLDIDFGAIQVTPNTLDAHRVIHWAGFEGKQHQMVTRLFQAYFKEGRDIGDSTTLAGLAADVGMDKDVVARMLKTDTDVQAIKDRDAQSREMGVRSVPTFIVAGQHVVPGAQPVQLWLDVIDEITGAGKTIQ
ncbi:MAG: DsbA family oxidoreductase [Paracoccaceae bacterium]|jgi:predicted DsbA family dithiol-disulfide isomerase|nr:DsbA family oxidoreductase [Paracoccaceae bacterium]MDP7184370.1 DsbA family oxidoreductase [Paracoccaceae bacterium]